MRKRDKAQDVFLQTKHYLGRPGSFQEAFPTIKSLKVTVEEYDGPWLDRTYHYDEHTAAQYINCHNPLCYNGGFNLGQQLWFMTEAGETTLEHTFFCQGYEGSPKGRIRYGSCDRRFKVKIEIVYREDTDEPGKM
ncbi:hypothetical protein [Symbiobacterium thermophilum]|uniref:Uncharacterized protein n=1 Tax=Symbiobacterium thermophilum TaxID=2734 RepID=A0A953LG33_SYMTR|nr:hypothetical protein [Symbiobacterium thermophilum]MBY6278240.1 hypothetical protein [Symbiobacterium thermophilum]